MACCTPRRLAVVTGDMRQEPMKQVRPIWAAGITVGLEFQEPCCSCGLEKSLWVAGGEAKFRVGGEHKNWISLDSKNALPSPIPAGSHMWLTLEENRERAFHTQWRRVSHIHQTEESGCRVLEQTAGCGKRRVRRDGVCVCKERGKETRASLVTVLQARV